MNTAKTHGVELRQSYKRLSKNALFMQGRYRHARQGKRANRQVRKLKTYLGRVTRDIERKINNSPNLQEQFASLLETSRRLLRQQRQDKNKLYSLHAPEVECIAKGKAYKKYEFGCKASYAVTNKSNFIVGAKALHGKPFDGHTLGTALTQVERLTGVKPGEVHVDLGYRGHRLEDEEIEIILARRKRGITPAKRKRQKRRNAIEPIIGHCKNDRKVGPRNWLQGKIGDQINAISMAIGFNLRKILKKIFLWLFYRLLKSVWIPLNPMQNALFYG